MELLQSQAPAKREYLGFSAAGTLELRHLILDMEIGVWILNIRVRLVIFDRP